MNFDRYGVRLGFTQQFGFQFGFALNTVSGLPSFTQSSGEHLDLSDILSAILLADTFLLGAVGLGGEALNTTHYWMEDSLNATTVVQASGSVLDAAGAVTTLVVAAANNIRVGALLVDIAAGMAGECIQVTAVSSLTLTITRGYGSSSTLLHGATPTFRIISMPVNENDTTIADRSKARTRVSNQTQIFKSEVEISGTMLQVDQAGIPNELNYQLANRTLELRRELGMTVYHGRKSADAGSNTSYRSMNGFRNFIAANSSQVIAQSSAALDENVVNTLYRTIYNAGAEAGLCVGEATQVSRFATIHADKVRLSASEKMRGLFVQKFLTDLGQELDLLIDRWLPTDELMITDVKRAKLLPLRGRQWQMQPLAKAGDGVRAMLIGEYTFELRNAGQAHALATGLSVA